jgi:hypothetical protein
LHNTVQMVIAQIGPHPQWMSIRVISEAIPSVTLPTR